MFSYRQNHNGPSQSNGRSMRMGARGPVRAIMLGLIQQGWLIFGIATFLCIIALIIISGLPGRYKSEAIILIQPGSNLSDSTSGPAQTPPDIVRSQMEILKSPTVVSKVVDKFGLINEPEFSKNQESQIVDPKTRRAEVVANILEDLEVENDGRSSTIRIGFVSRSPLKTQRIVDEIAKEYIIAATDLKNNSVDATKQRLDSQVESLRVEMLEAEQSAENFRRSVGLVWLNPGSDGSDIGGGMTYQARLLDEFSREAADISGMATLAKAKQASGSKNMPEILSSNAINALLQRDAELAETEASMATRYNAKYPPLVRIRTQRARLAATLNATKNNYVSSVNVEVARAQAANAAANAKAQTLERAVNKQISDSVRYRQMQRDALAKRKAYERTSEQSGIVSQRLMLQLPNAIIIAPASLPIKEIGPKRVILYVISCIVAIFVGLFFGFISEYKRTRLRNH